MEKPEDTNPNNTSKIDEDKQAEIMFKMIEMVTRQTEYTFDEAKEKLVNNNLDYNKVIKEYMGIEDKPKEKTSLNQEIFKQIRNKMDIASKNFYN